jgi:hypothetical protein
MLGFSKISPHPDHVHLPYKLLITFSTIPLLTQCEMGSAPSTNIVTGPFDSRGNYIEDWVDKPHKWYKPSNPTTQPKPTELASNNKPEPHPEITVVQPKPPTQVAAKPKPKPKPKPAPPKVVRHTVKKGDTLSAIARRYGSSVSSIQRANGLKGTIIRIGQSLKIPK